MKYYVVSDIHGCKEELDIILEKYNPAEETLIFLGDYIDRGKDSLGVLETVMTMYLLHGHDKVKVIRGNHDQMFLDSVAGDKNAYSDLKYNGGIKFLMEIIEVAYPKKKPLWLHTIRQDILMKVCKENIPGIIDFLKKQTLLYYHDSSFAFTHAGFDFKKEDWRDTSRDDFLWIRKHFFGPNNTGLINIFGHTRTSTIRGNKDDHSVWVSPCKTFIGIDGGCAYGGQLNAIVIDSENPTELTVYAVQTGKTIVETKQLSLV